MQQEHKPSTLMLKKANSQIEKAEDHISENPDPSST